MSVNVWSLKDRRGVPITHYKTLEECRRIAEMACPECGDINERRFVNESMVGMFGSWYCKRCGARVRGWCPY